MSNKQNLSKMILLYPSAYKRLMANNENQADSEFINRKLIPTVKNENLSDSNYWYKIQQELIKNSNLKRKYFDNNILAEDKKKIQNKNLRDNTTQTKCIFKNDADTQTKFSTGVGQTQTDFNVNESFFEDDNAKNEKLNCFSPNTSAVAAAKRLKAEKSSNKHKDFKIIEKDGAVYTVIGDDINENKLEEYIEKPRKSKKTEIEPKKHATRSRNQNGNNKLRWVYFK